MLNGYYFLALQVHTLTSLKGITGNEATVDFIIFFVFLWSGQQNNVDFQTYQTVEIRVPRVYVRASLKRLNGNLNQQLPRTDVLPWQRSLQQKTQVRVPVHAFQWTTLLAIFLLLLHLSSAWNLEDDLADLNLAPNEGVLTCQSLPWLLLEALIITWVVSTLRSQCLMLGHLDTHKVPNTVVRI